MLTIHAGLHKTGSTAIQQYLSRAPKEVRKGLAYLKARSNKFSRNDGVAIPTNPEQWRALTSRALATHRDVVVSDEGIFGSPWGDSNMYIETQERAGAISRAFAGLTDFQVVVYLRPQYQWFESLYTQMIQQGESISPDGFIAKHADSNYVSYSRLVSDLTSVLGGEHLVFRAYRPGNDVVEDFLAVIGRVGPPVLDGARLANVSINPAQVELLRRINETGEDPTTGQLGRIFFQGKGFSHLRRDYSVFPALQQQQLLNRTKEDWEHLGAAVAQTRLAQPAPFQDIAEGIDSLTLRPFIGAPENCEEIIGETTRAFHPLIQNAMALKSVQKRLVYVIKSRLEIIRQTGTL